MNKLERFRRRRLSNQSARIMVAALRDAGIRPEPALAAAGVRMADVERPDGVLTGSQELRLEREFVARTREVSGLWLDLGFRYRLLSYGPFGLAILNARTVDRALEIAAGFHELAFTLIDYRVLRDERGDAIGMGGDLTWVPAELRDFMVERDLSAVRRLLDDMIHGPFPVAEIHAAISVPDDPERYASALATPVRFDAPATRFVFDPRWRDLDMPYGNPILEETYERQCRELLGELESRSSEIEQVVDLLVRCRGHWPTVDEAASRLGTSSRTLRRRLESAQTSYRGLLEGVRRKQAEELLSATRLTVEQIADSLGYAETASFTHAFKRWTGRSPREFRRG